MLCSCHVWCLQGLCSVFSVVHVIFFLLTIYMHYLCTFLNRNGTIKVLKLLLVNKASKRYIGAISWNLALDFKVHYLTNRMKNEQQFKKNKKVDCMSSLMNVNIKIISLKKLLA